MEKTIYKLKLHETLLVEEKFENSNEIKVTKTYEVTRVPGGWVYSFEYPAFRQSPVIFVPYNSEFDPDKTVLVGPTLASVTEEKK